MHLASEHELLDHRFPYVLWPLKPLAYELELLAPDEPRDRAINRCAAAKRRCALVLAPNACVYLEPDGTWGFSDQPPTGGVVVSVAPTPEREAKQNPEVASVKAPEPPRGIEILRDDQDGKVWIAEKCGKRDRWRIVRYEPGPSGKLVREKEYEGDAHGFYLYARDEVGCDLDEVPWRELRLPNLWSLYGRAVTKQLLGKRFSDDVYSICCSWTVQYSISRTRNGWMVYVALEPWDSDPLRDPEIEFYGPFGTKRQVREYLDARGLNSEVKF